MRTITVDGRTAAYDEHGDGRGTPLLCVHGFSGGRGDFTGVLPALAAGRRALAVDLPGHGASEGPDDPAAYGLAGLAGWVLDVLDALDLGEVHLLGHSLGGLVAQRVAQRASQRLRSLVLMDTGLGAVREEVGERIVRIAVAARDHGPEAALEVAIAASGDGADVPEEERRAGLARFRSVVPAAMVGEASSLLGAVPVSAFLRGIDVPVLVLHGADDDVWLPAEQALLARTAAGAELAVVPDAAHSPQRENPQAWLEAVGGFLDRVERGGAGIRGMRRRRSG
jgi:pimeloyl-ACP methyl ester carboxylesterase